MYYRKPLTKSPDENKTYISALAENSCTTYTDLKKSQKTGKSIINY